MSLKWLETWYKNHCDGLWEHSYGIIIDTLDNPGWGIRINLVGTEVANKDFKPVKIERTESDWVHCSVKNHIFQGAGGPENLEEILEIFKSWVTNLEDNKGQRT